MKIKAFFFLFLISSISVFAQSVKSPAEYLGYEIGSRFTRHHQVVDYFKYVSNTLSNVKLEKYGETNEHRELYVTYISSQENINNLETIRKQNLSQTKNSNASSSDKAIVWLSYNVHGNEASSTEASMLTLFDLVTNKKEWLENTVVIIDPCINPDGRDRYVNWYNQVKSTPFDIGQDAKEHHEPWPGGRPNHYLFDLNRDWAWATQVESQQRVKIYNKWMPHIHVDFHEQGINNPYYFAPAAEPFHEIITDWQRDFQTQIGKNHAKYFDKEGWLYFTKESFDLLYPSYGDTYPTFMGAIGMTYEQAGHGRAGLGIETDEGEVLTLKDRAIHHKTTGLSTVEIASKNAEKLNIEFKKYFNNDNVKYKSFLIKNENQDKINRLKLLLDKHEISYETAKGGTVKGYDFSTQKEAKFNASNNDLVIHTDQPKGKMVNVLFEPSAKLVDSLTYDITAWSLPYAHGFNAIASKSKLASNTYNDKDFTPNNTIDKNAYAFIFKWNSLNDATFLADLLQHNIIPRFSEKPFTTSGKSFERGTIIVLKNDNRNSNFADNLINIANKHKRQVTTTSTGFSDAGVDFGSYSVKPINKQKVALLSGEGTSSLSFGEIWHFFETELKYPLVIIDSDYFGRTDFSNYDVIILPNGYYNSILNKSTLDKLTSFARSGGTVIAIGSALNSFADKKGFSLTRKKLEDKKDNNLLPYAAQERNNVENLITGAIFKSTIDTTHPLGFGYKSDYFSLKLSGSTFNYLNSGVNVGYFDKNATNVSGFAGKTALKNVPESLLFGVDEKGRGSFVYMVDNPLFRSFWDNGKLFLANAVFLLNSDQLK
ncbi:M14 family metallopeptidase [Polaribacter sp. MED152]|uniref:M14 family metallopeptidase n=1 Tax=Polaribacter sp. MED152 TaxID=313598 RepID=UPI000068CA82|nr:M14 family metallopeptidase [Polaribacter sp. MED152]EAQ41838.1 zinc carboxypeptidase [Polaribacter sp. MED152]